MRPDPLCEQMRGDLSAYIDDELTPSRRSDIESHLLECTSCRKEESALRAVRRLVRVQPVEDVPDLAPRIMARIEGRRAAGTPWRERIRIASVAAAAAALLILGATLPFDRATTDIAAANEVTEGVRRAARDLRVYSARFAITEHGWHDDVPVRRMVARVRFRAPEDFRLELEDHTDYPSAQWPRNDVTLVASSDRWWIEEPSSCPAVALPDCAAPTTWAGVTERRVVVDRQPFDGSSALPTDIVVPLETLAAAEGFDVLGSETVSGRSSHRLRLDHRHALPLITALQAGGAWREFHPLDRVDIWIDAETWFPLRFRVVAGDSPDRDLWSTRRDLSDRPGDTLLEVSATSFSEPESLPADTFDVPSSGQRRDGGFTETGRTLGPTSVAGLSAYRAGRTADGQVITTYSDGMSYLKISRSPASDASAVLAAAEEIRLAGGGFGYYLPASATFGRRLVVLRDGNLLQLQTNLPRATLVVVASDLKGAAERAPRMIQKTTAVTVRRIDPARALEEGLVPRPTYLPEGYEPATASIARSRDDVRSATVYFRRTEGEFDGLGVRIVQSAPVEFLPPSSEEFIEIKVSGEKGRWSPERGELEWIEDGIYRAVAVPAADLATALRIAEGLR